MIKYCKLFTHEFSDFIQNLVNDSLADGVVTSGVVVGSILLASDQLLGVEELAVWTSANLICRKKRNYHYNKIHCHQHNHYHHHHHHHHHNHRLYQHHHHHRSYHKLTDDSWLKIHQHSPWHMLPSTGLAEESIEGVVSTPASLVTGHLTIRLDAVLQAVQLPAGIAHLDSGLADMNWDTFTLKC